MGKSLAVAFLTLAASSAGAAQWEVIDAAQDQSVIVYVDQQSITKDRTYRKAWVRYSYATDQVGKPITEFKPYRSTLWLNWFDCSARKSAAGKLVVYAGLDGTGDVLHTSTRKNPIADLDDVTPGTLGERALAQVCSVRLP